VNVPLLLICAAVVAAQPANTATAQPADDATQARNAPQSASSAEDPLPRWDAFAFIGWRGAHIEDSFYTSGRWDGRFVYGGTAGYYLTPNLKAEVDVSLTPSSRYYEHQPRTVAGSPYPLYVRFDHRVVTAAVGGLVIYQFFENASFHPFVGVGAGLLRIRDTITTDRQIQTFQRTPTSPPEVILLAEEETRRRTDSLGRGLLVAGFKAYPGERVFFRMDAQWSPSSGLARDISWRLGVGVDF
jgi:opacity protein-like surface antigen